MKDRAPCAGLLLLLVFVFVGYAQKDGSPVLKGPYLGQNPPGMTPEIFAPGIVSTCLDELNSVFSPDGQEFYFCVRNMDASSLFVMSCVDGAWGRPEPLPFAGPYNDIDVSLSPDGQKLFFCSNRPVAASGPPKEDHDIWMCERQGATWGPPQHLGDAVNSPRDDFFPVVTKSRSLYFNSQRAGPGTNDIYMCRWVDGKYAPAEKLGPEINSEFREFDAFVSPDETFMIFTSQRPAEDRFGDLYISFKSPAGAWMPARNMGKAINGFGPEFGTALSPDGKFLFFTRQTAPRVVRTGAIALTYDDYLKMHNSPDNGSENIWWVDAKIIEELKSRRTPEARPRNEWPGLKGGYFSAVNSRSGAITPAQLLIQLCF
jgi:WD40-like Beta Propeller Repeat